MRGTVLPMRCEDNIYPLSETDLEFMLNIRGKAIEGSQSLKVSETLSDPPASPGAGRVTGHHQIAQSL